MKKLKKAFLFALIVSVALNGFGFLIAILNSSFESAFFDFKRIFPISISILFIPCFLSVIFFKPDLFKNKFKALKQFLKPALISFVLVYVIVFFSLLPDAKPTHKSLYIVALFNSILSVVITLFSMLIYYLLNTKRAHVKTHLAIKPSIIKTFLIFFLISIVFNILIFSFGNSSWINFKVPFHLFTKGLLITMFSFFAFQFVFNKGRKTYLIIMVYVVGVLLIPFVFTELYSDFSFENFIKKLNVNLSIIAPYFLLIMLAIHTYFIVLANKLEKESLKLTSVSVNIKYQQLKAQLSPHFLFNNISVLTGLIEENPERAVSFSEKLSAIYRYFLDQENKDLAFLDEEISFGKKYMDLLQIRYENALSVTFNLNDTNNYYILPFALQQVFENIIKHNIISIEKPMSVQVNLENDYLVIINTLNLKPDENTNTKTGLENLKKRYSYFSDRLILVDSDTETYSIKLPLLKA
ncbi:sensor histidine kinase [Hanstruepera flava]|uniref:sensor histidine kinase n=1 Tax=Hanstruepera flava TaxID=2930218 RepID=UPI00202792F3|nr:sensor histidine kinase [Hanstruepera flava]